MAEKDKELTTNINRLLDKKFDKNQIPSVFLLALRDWDKGFLQLKRRAFFEMAPLKSRWGFFVLVLMLADYKTGILKISWKDLVAITGLARENVYKILRYLDKRDYINYLPAKNKYRSHIIVKVVDYKKFVSKPKGYSDKTSLQDGSCRDKSSLQRNSCSDNASPQKSVTGDKTMSCTPLNNNVCLDNNTTTGDVVDFELLEKQKTLLECNQTYKEDIINRIQNLFREKAKIEIAKDLIFGRANSLLERFLIENVVANIKRIRWGPNVENPIGLLIKSLESKYELPPSLEERMEEEKQRREKEDKEFKKRMAEYESQRVDYSYARTFLNKMKKVVEKVRI